MPLVAAAVSQQSTSDWWSDHSTLIVGVVGIVVSGLLGPAVTALLTSQREANKDDRAALAAAMLDLRSVIDEAAEVLGGAVAKLRPLLIAEREGADPPQEAADFLRSLFPLGQRLRLRLPEGDPVVQTYDDVIQKLVALSKALASQNAFDSATKDFETARKNFLEAGRQALARRPSEGKP